MQNNPQPYRFSGLLAILGLVVLVLGVVIMLLPAEMRLAAWGLLALGAILVAVAFVMDFRRVSGALAGRRGRLRLGTTVMVSSFLGITLLVNAISINNFWRYDSTSLGQFTLSDQTKAMLKQLKDPVQVLAFYEPGDSIGGYGTDLLSQYERLDPTLSHNVIDPVANPDQARQYNLDQFPAYVFKSKNRQRIVPTQEIVQMDANNNPTYDFEFPFSSALLEVTGKAQKKVYFLTGHGEDDINTDYSMAMKGLEDDLYKVGTLDLLTNPKIPADCAALIIAGPKTDLQASEVDTIGNYLKYGGQVMVLANSSFPPGLNKIVSAWGVGLEKGTVIDPKSNAAPRQDIPVVPASQDAFGLPTTYFPGAIALVPEKAAPSGTQGRPLLITSDASYLKRNYDPTVKPTFDKTKDLMGPLTLGTLVVDPPPAGAPASIKMTRLAVIGDTDFATNQNIASVNNSDLFLNTVSWLTDETKLITIRHNVLPFRQLVVDPAQANFMQYSSLLLLPLAVLMVGGVIWWKRR